MAATLASTMAGVAQIGNPAQKAAQVFSASTPSAVKVSAPLVVRAQAEEKQSRRAALAFIATSVTAASFANSAQAVAPVKLGPTPPPIGGLPGTESSDQARDTDAPLKERWFLQGQTPEGALKRAKETLAVLPEIEGYISRSAWPYVRNELRSEFGYLRYDLQTVVNSKAKAERKALEKEIDAVVEEIEKLDFAARSKSKADAEKLFGSATSKLKALIAKLE